MRILLVEDSRTVRAYVEAALSEAPDISLLPAVNDGQTAVLVANTALPDLILMDLCLPELDGVAAIAEIMASAPCPIVVLSGALYAPDRDRTFESLSAGAVEVLAKPQSLEKEAFAAFRKTLITTVRLMKDARIVRRRASRGPGASSGSYGLPAKSYDLVAIGASTGGPPVIYELLRGVRPPYPLPVLIAQHVLPGFEPGMAAWLGHTGHDVRVAQAGAPLRPGVVYLLPSHLECRVRRVGLELRPRPGSPVDAVGPPIDPLFESTAESFGSRSAAFLLSGMGSDGARGLLCLRRAGALTVTQSRDSCIVDGMPAEARALGAGLYDLSPPDLLRLFSRIGAPLQGGVPPS